ncbi:hypothetical protein RHMOL_Rhmol13G0152200 [Rhododendron molle]|uniref:Uncharacterized protein n=1 Tax=Rhododendron molle TaxID=49168 RepID=A0ACC0L7H9_RHOML|nr:hypothetical protein RHMOL_Rhmol13G0152200 [Rhododendron molle]
MGCGGFVLSLEMVVFDLVMTAPVTLCVGSNLVMAMILVRFERALRVLDATDHSSLGTNGSLPWRRAFGGYGGGV